MALDGTFDRGTQGYLMPRLALESIARKRHAAALAVREAAEQAERESQGPTDT
ncbi:hypothetical protein RAJCM14343_2736 [Rhodococcus aetherivorans]|uniref:Uncharacterized protein n=1 Tax=Rhodococcus aetherivorans TaxID=191292 RepID=A0ABQ0YLN2_9NOCA|nr:hypothetical protein RR21198_1382 [Rhodococcus rhodochrous ATCC 21198]GES37481.1 hypothetical protein RAJCM14343_2736 [Rhodococcus aetherivorans]